MPVPPQKDQSPFHPYERFRPQGNLRILYTTRGAGTERATHSREGTEINRIGLTPPVKDEWWDAAFNEQQVKTQPGKYTSRVRGRKQRKATAHDTDAILELVRQGVRRFILKDAPIGDFQRTIRAAAKRGELSSHPLTGVVFRRIVKEAIRERKSRTSKE